MYKDLRQLWSYRGLLWSLVLRDLRLKYKSSVLGFLWTLLHPLLMMSIYAIIFSILIRQKVDGPYPIFLLAGILPWLFFASSLTLTAPSLISGGALINKVFFPREILPLAIIGANLINFLLSLLVFFLFLLFFQISVGRAILLLPLLIFVHVLFSIGLALVLAACNVRYRDIGHAIDIVLQLWFFSVPVIYSVEFLGRMVGPQWLRFYYLNPMVYYIEMYRDILMYGRFPDFEGWLIVISLGIISFLSGYRFFKKREFELVKEI